MKIVVNGEEQQVPEGLSVSELLAHLRLPAERIALERNLEILPRAKWTEVRVQEGDRYEIVHFVGGG